MRRLYPILLTLAIVVLLIIGFLTVEGPWRTTDPGVPQDQVPAADAPEDVDETPRSAEQNIDEP